MKKKTIEEIKEYALKENYECISEDYINSKEKLKWLCNNKHICFISWNDFHQGHRCSKCINKSKPNIEDIRKFALLDGTQCISENYKNNKFKLEFQCNNSHQIYRCNWNNFYNGSRCPICKSIKNSKLKSIENDVIDNFLNENNFKLKNIFFKNNKRIITVICSKNHIEEKQFSSLKNLLKCKTCYLNKNKGITHNCYNPDRTRSRRLSFLKFNLSNIKMLNMDINYNHYLESKEQVENKLIKKNKYTVDHIFPRVAFIDNNLDKIYEPDFIYKICNLQENLNIITEKENLKKSAKYNNKDFLKWFENKLIIQLMNI